MKKIIIPVLFVVMFCDASDAQVKNTAFAAVRYTFLYVADTTEPSDISTENMILYLGMNMSAYKSYDRVLRDSAMKEQLYKSKMEMASGGGISIGSPGMKAASATVFYKDMPNAKLKRIESLLNNYVIEEALPVINWTITPETKSIQELACQKATAFFRGRNYTAWFCSQLPYNDGPWKLNGLPGLIIEAADDKNEVVFRFAGFEDVSSRHISISIPDNAIKATAIEFKQLQDAARNDPQGFLNGSLAALKGSMAASGVTIKINNVTITPNGSSGKKKVNNNPIELTAN